MSGDDSDDKSDGEEMLWWVERLIADDEDDDEQVLQIPTIDEACQDLEVMPINMLRFFCQDLLRCGKFDDFALRRHLAETSSAVIWASRAIDRQSIGNQ